MKKVLVADDEIEWRSSIGTLLQALGYETVYATSLPEAIDRLSSTSFDLVITDNRMPNADDGISLLQYLDRRRSKCRKILHTNSGGRDILFACEVLGARYVRKSYSELSELEAAVRSALT